MSTTPTTPQWAIEAAKELSYRQPTGCNRDVQHQLDARIIAKHAPSPAAQPTDEAKLREVIRGNIQLSKDLSASGFIASKHQIDVLTDRILTALEPHLAQREPGDSELLDWLETTRRALFTRDSSGVVKFDAETSATDWHCVNAPTFRQAVKSAQRGEGKP